MVDSALPVGLMLGPVYSLVRQKNAALMDWIRVFQNQSKVIVVDDHSSGEFKVNITLKFEKVQFQFKPSLPWFLLNPVLKRYNIFQFYFKRNFYYYLYVKPMLTFKVHSHSSGQDPFANHDHNDHSVRNEYVLRWKSFPTLVHACHIYCAMEVQHFKHL